MASADQDGSISVRDLSSLAEQLNSLSVGQLGQLAAGRPAIQLFNNVNISGPGRTHVGNYYASNATTSEPVRKPFMVPFSRDKHFVPRGTTVDDLESLVDDEGHSRMALCGMAGVGKTQIATEFAHRYCANHVDAAIFWIYAGSRDRVLASFHHVARALNLPELENPQADLVQAVFDHLSDHRNKPWLLVLDNIDESSILEESLTSSNMTLSYLPQTTGCTVLLTTRDERIAFEVAGYWSEPVKIDAMNLIEARSLLQNKLPIARLHTIEDNALLEELGCLPLAITTSAAYMLRYRINTQKYLENLRNRPQEMLDEQSTARKFRDVRRDRDQESAVYASFRLSFSRLMTESYSAVRALFVLVCFAPGAIPSHIVSTGDHEIDKSLSESLGTLIALAFISEIEDGCAYTIHTLVRNFVGDEIKREGLGQECITLARKLLNWDYAGIGHTKDPLVGWTQLSSLMPHMQAALYGHFSLDTQLSEAGDYLTKASLLQIFGRQLLGDDRCREAKAALEESYDIFKTFEVEDDDGRKMSSAGEDLARALLGLGEYAQAETLCLDLIRSEESKGRTEIGLLNLKLTLADLLLGIPERIVEAEKLLLDILIQFRERKADDVDCRTALIYALRRLSNIYFQRIVYPEEHAHGTDYENDLFEIQAYLTEYYALYALKELLEVGRVDLFTMSWWRDTLLVHALMKDLRRRYWEAEVIYCTVFCVANLQPSFKMSDSIVKTVVQKINQCLRKQGKQEETEEDLVLQHSECKLDFNGCRLSTITWR